ncbi:HYR domain-containing protein [Pontibacter sp. JH31]|uniref:HYR domain-containing protein n=1 Tax=Pontibacter aquaedesilientis TaxID=2766980 RepID=A0ABR7XKQ5_9BACT|nr:HYR domain-containing protein [Pontibacter aquaedesilientis]MBD1398871.1 HYR domain-containing protein [Pontibacter aquaedesilientis]
MHLIAENIYIGIKFLSWTENNQGGGFSYERTTQCGAVSGDNNAPVAVAKALVVTADGSCQGTAIAQAFDNGSSDADGDALTFSVSPVGPYASGVTNVTFTVTDCQGASSSVATTITVEDETAPYLSGVVGEIKADYYSGTNFNTFKYSEVVSEINKDWGVGSPNASVLGNDYFSIRYTAQFRAPVTGTYTFRTLTDDGVRLWVNNTQVISQWIEMSPTSLVGTIELSAGQTVPVVMEYFENGGGALAQLSYTAPGATEVVFKTDAPSCKDVTLVLDNAGKATLSAADVDGGYEDNCGIASRTLSQSVFTGEDLGVKSVVLTISDAAGNSSTCTVKVTVVDNTAPVFTSTQENATVALGDNCQATLTDYAALATATDNSGSVTITQSPAVGTALAKDVATTVTLTAEDASGNKVTQNFTVTAKDQTAPIAKAKNITVQLSASNTATITADQVNDGSSDNCAIERLALDKTSFDCSNVGIENTVTLTVTDANGNVSTATAVVTVEEKTAPSITAPSAVSVSTDAGKSFASNVTLGTPTTSDNCSVASVTNNAPATFPFGSTTVTWTVTDGSGNKTTATQLVTVKDTEAPVPNVANLPKATGECVVTLTAPTATDNTAGTITGTTSAPLEYRQQGTYTITWTYNDGQGNITSQTQDVEVKDVTAPVFAAVTSISKNSDFDKCGATITYSTPVATDNCSTTAGRKVLLIWDVINTHTTSLKNALTAAGMEVTLSTTKESEYDGTNPSLTEFDAVIHLNGETYSIAMPIAGQNALVDFVINKGKTYITNEWSAYEVDASQSMTAMNDIVVLNRTGGFTDISTYTMVAEQSGHPLMSGITASFTLPRGGGNGGDARVYSSNQPLVLMTSAQGAAVAVREFSNGGKAIGFQHAGNYSSFPILSDENVQKLYLNAVKYSNSDNIAVTQIAGLPSGSLFPIGVTKNTFEAKDSEGNTSTISFDVTIEDKTAPVAKTKNLTVQLDAAGKATITTEQINNSSTDNCTIASLSLDKTSFDCSNVGNNNVTLTVTDANGNSSTATAVVTVEDKIVPIAKAKNITVQLDATGKATITADQIDNGSSDNCAIKSLSLDKTSFDCSNVGKENTVTLTVTDESGNSSTATAVVAVEDMTAPVTKAKSITVQLDATGKATITADQVNDGSLDNCAIERLALDKTSFDCSNLGANDVTLTVTDMSGNTSTATIKVTVEDKIAPIARTKNITAQLDASGKGTITPEMINDGSSDICGDVTLALSKATFDCSNVGENTVTLTVTDKGNNVSTATAVVTIVDNTAPIAVAKDIRVILEANGTATIAASDINNGSNDACGIKSLSLDKTSFDCSHIGANTVILTVTDANDNVSTATATVTIVDNTAPIAKAQNITVQLDANGTATITADQIDNGSTDACGIKSLTLDKTSFDCSNVGPNTVTLTVTDVNNNVSTATAVVTVEDKTAPIAKAQNITVKLGANGTATITADQINNGSTDNCAIASLNLDKTSFDCSNVDKENTVTLTVTDESGNSSTATAIVTVEDKTAPTITAPAAVTVNVDPGKNTASNVNLGNPTIADNCSGAKATNDAPAVYPTGVTTVTWTVIDASGNKATATQTVTVLRNITSVATPTGLTVPIRTSYASLALPAKVTVTYSDGNSESISVNWAQGNYNGMVAGTYILTGQLVLPSGTTNVDNRTASITVVVEPNKVPTALAFSATTFKPDAQANEVIGTLTTTDPDDTEFVYTLVSGAGDSQNSLFEIRGDKVYLKSNKGLSGMTSFSIRVRSTDPYNNTIERSFTLTKEAYAKTEDQLKIVNAFSPNGDGINDNWTIPELRFYNQVNIQVFDRSGVRVFETSNPETGWDGRGPNGQILNGAFLYIVEVKDINWVKRGVVTILKK